MFLGHVALGLAAKRVTPRVSLGVLVLAAQLADTLWPLLVGLGVEHVRIDPGNTAVTPLDFISYPYSHSLVLLTLWGVLFARAYGSPGDRARVALPPTTRVALRPTKTSLVIAALVVSHWVLDWITHRPDMPIYPGGPKLGLGLWNSVAATVVVELLLYGAGAWVYLAVTRSRDRVGTWAFVALAVFLVVVYIANIFGPPPPSVGAIWIGALLGAALLTVWAWWADRHREII